MQWTRLRTVIGATLLAGLLLAGTATAGLSTLETASADAPSASAEVEVSESCLHVGCRVTLTGYHSSSDTTVGTLYFDGAPVDACTIAGGGDCTTTFSVGLVRGACYVAGASTAGVGVGADVQTACAG